MDPLTHIVDHLTHSWEDQGAHTFPKGISLKVNAIARLDIELVYNDVIVEHVTYYTTRTSPPVFVFVLKFMAIAVQLTKLSLYIYIYIYMYVYLGGISSLIHI